MMAAPPMSSSTDYDLDGYDGGVSDGELGVGVGSSSGLGDSGSMNHHQKQTNNHNGHPMDMDRYQDHDTSSQPHYMTGAFRGKPCSYYVNGDKHFSAKKIVVNPKHFRDMSHYLDHLTDKLDPAFGAIRKIHTPHHGTRVYNVNELKPGEAYVAAGSEKFRRIGYDQIISHERKKSPPYKYDANPVVHSRVFQCSGKIRKIENSSIIIKVWPNGGEKRTRRPRVVLLRRTAGWNMTTVVIMVNDMLKDDCNGPVESLYNRNGTKLSEVDSLEHNGVYVALTKRDRFKRASYPDFATKDLHTSPRPDRKMLDPLYSLSNNNSTSNSSPEHSNASSSQGVSVNGQPRRRPPKREEDQVFPAKPVKHNRSFDRAKKVDLDKDEGGVFKAKNSNSHTRGAREVNDSRHIKTELPLDQQKAEEVDEDVSSSPKDDHYNQYSRQPQQRVQPRGVAPQQNGSYTEAKANSRRAPQQQQQHQQQRRQTNPQRGAPAKKEPEREVNAEREQSPQAAERIHPRPPSISPVNSERRANSGPRRTMSPQRSHSPPSANDFREEEKAATQIQAGYRGFVARKQIQAEKAARSERERASSEVEDYQSIARDEANKVVDSASNRYDEEEKAATKIQAGFRGFQSRKEFEAKRLQQDVRSQNKEEDLAATKIQAGYRGHKARSSLREMNNNKNDKPGEVKAVADSPKPQPPPPRPAIDDDDDDDEDDYDKAATKIQAGFRGYQARKNLRL